MLKLNRIFTDGMILQAEKPIRLFGEADGTVRATIGEASVSCEARDGRFLLELPALDYGVSADITLADSESEVTLRGVLFGDVYIFAGQSNLQLKLRAAKPDGEIFECGEVKLFSCERIEKSDRFTPEDGWVALSRDSAPDLSALAYYTARELYRAKKRPIGVISAHQGASIIESWLSREALDGLALELLPAELHPDHRIENYSRWNRDSVLFELDILPLFPLSLKAIVWYQGESNTGVGDSKVYGSLLTALVSSWRKGFRDAELPFVIVQLADFCPAPEWVNQSAWRVVQAEQASVCERLHGCRLAVSRDVCETDDIHPPTKHILASRIAELLALPDFEG